MTNYHAYLRGYASGSGPSKEELKLRVARQSGCPKKLVDALNTLPGVEGVGTQVPHLEGEEIFGSTKRKLELPIGDARHSHRPDKVNFSQPRVRTRSTKSSEELLEHSGTCNEANPSQYVTVAFESDCDTLKWHIARISHKSVARCQAQQRTSNIKCSAKIAKGKKETPTLLPRRLFNMSKIFNTVLYDQPPPTNFDAYPTVRNNCTIRRIANALSTEQRNKWESAGNIREQIVEVTLLHSWVLVQ